CLPGAPPSAAGRRAGAARAPAGRPARPRPGLLPGATAARRRGRADGPPDAPPAGRGVRPPGRLPGRSRAMNARPGQLSGQWDGLWLPLVTPLRDSYLDITALQALARHYARAGVAGFVLFGSTGEGNLISMKEKFLACDAVRAAAPGLPIVLGAGGVDPQSIYHAVRKLDRLQPDGWLVPPPYYLRPAPDGILWHYQQIAWASRQPIIIYDVP